MEIEIVRILVGSLGTIGLLISLYFALVFHGILSPDSSLVPSICRMQKSSCTSILDSRDARLAGIQNFYLGMGYYGLVLLWVFENDLAEWFTAVLRPASGLTVLAGAYLTFSLLFRLNVKCVLCFVGHAINFILFLIFSLVL